MVVMCACIVEGELECIIVCVREKGDQCLGW